MFWKNNKRGSLADIAVVMFVFIVIAFVIMGRASDDEYTSAIGGYQNQILDSYTVAEGARLFAEDSARYAFAKTVKDMGCVTFDAGFISAFKQDFNIYISSFPEYNMGLVIRQPYIDTLRIPRYNVAIEDNILKIGAPESIKVTNENTVSTQLSNLEFKTELNSYIEYEINCEEAEELAQLM
jgi:hypothetical protein